MPDSPTPKSRSAPPFPPARGEDEPPEGYHYEWAVDTLLRWKVYDGNARKCRWTVGPAHAQCKRPAVAVLDRDRTGRRPNLWGYCEDHLFGRVIHDGVLWSVVLRPDATGQSTDSSVSEAQLSGTTRPRRPRSTKTIEEAS